VENFRFFDLKLYALADPQAAVAKVKVEALIKHTGRIYRQDYVFFLRAAGDKIALLREYFRSGACGQGTGHADSWSRILRISGDRPAAAHT
jgi:ketosteroid isomerase-like protein